MIHHPIIPSDWTVEQAWQMTELLDGLICEIHRRYEVRFAIAHDVVNRQFELHLGHKLDDEDSPLPRIAPRPLPNVPEEFEAPFPYK